MMSNSCSSLNLFSISISLFFLFPQNIVNTVGEEIKRLLEIFLERNPMFNGKYSVCGHSLGNSQHGPLPASGLSLGSFSKATATAARTSKKPNKFFFF